MNQHYLSRAEAAEYVRGRGLPCTRLTLQKLATVGGGPTYRRFGHRAVYTPADLDGWIAQKLSAPLSSTSAAFPGKSTGGAK